MEARQLTESELIEAIREAMQPQAPEDNGARTTEEIVRALDVSEKKVRLALHRLKSEGRLEIFDVRRQVLDDTWRWKKAYRVR